MKQVFINSLDRTSRAIECALEKIILIEGNENKAKENDDYLELASLLAPIDNAIFDAEKKSLSELQEFAEETRKALRRITFNMLSVNAN